MTLSAKNTGRLISIQERLKENPRIANKDLGKPWGISTQRVQQLLKEAGIKKERAIRSGWGLCAKGHSRILTMSAFRASPRFHRSRRYAVTGYSDFVKYLPCYECKPLRPTKEINRKGDLVAIQLTAPCGYCGELVTRRACEMSSVKMLTDDRYKGHQFCNKNHFYKWNNEVRKWWSDSPIYQKMLERKNRGESFTVPEIIAEYKREMNPTTFQKFKVLLNNIKSPFIAGLI